ncbi:MAG: aminoacyl-tRNA hydrolase [Gemmataceae bacterium]
MHLVVGLGNPGKRYERTRHNVGFEVIDRLAENPNAEPFREKFQAQLAELQDDAEKIILVKPQTFMNLSGQCVREIVDFYKLDLANLLIIADDINLPLGKLRFRPKGSHGGQNGLRDIQNRLGTNEYQRLRIGVGAPNDDAVDHVLGKFRPSEKDAIEDALFAAVQGVALWWREGIEKCMNEYNGDNKE